MWGKITGSKTCDFSARLLTCQALYRQKTPKISSTKILSNHPPIKKSGKRGLQAIRRPLSEYGQQYHEKYMLQEAPKQVSPSHVVSTLDGVPGNPQPRKVFHHLFCTRNVSPYHLLSLGDHKCPPKAFNHPARGKLLDDLLNPPPIVHCCGQSPTILVASRWHSFNFVFRPTQARISLGLLYEPPWAHSDSSSSFAGPACSPELALGCHCDAHSYELLL